MNHPNRSRRRDNPARNPTPDEIRAGRETVEMTQAEAAAVLFSSERAWQDWEGGRRRMHPIMWWAFRVRTGQAAATT